MIRHTLPILALLAVTPAFAGPREDVYSASLRCSAITDNRTWLECYYGAAQPMRGELQLPAAPASQTALIPPAIGGPALGPSAMGAPTAYLPGQAPVPAKPGPVGRTMDYLVGGTPIVANMPVKTYSGGGDGGFTVTLADGQVWKQIDDQNRSVRWRDRPEAHRVSIWKGALGTFNLGFDDEGDKYKVRKTK